jgi:hypothetical protein
MRKIARPHEVTIANIAKLQVLISFASATNPEDKSKQRLETKILGWESDRSVRPSVPRLGDQKVGSVLAGHGVADFVTQGPLPQHRIEPSDRAFRLHELG